MHITIAGGTTGRVLDRKPRDSRRPGARVAARAPIELPCASDAPSVTVASLAAAERQASRVVAAPGVNVAAGPTRVGIPRWRLARILRPPDHRDTPISSGPTADAYFRRLENAVDRAPKDADFAVNSDGSVRVGARRGGRALDVPRSAERSSPPPSVPRTRRRARDRHGATA